MPRLRIPRPIGPQILPENRIPLDRSERDAFPGRPRSSFSSVYSVLVPVTGPVPRFQLRFFLPTLQKPTPPGIDRHTQAREIRSPTGTVTIEVDHERAGAVAAARDGAGPVIVVLVVAGGVVALGPHALDVQVWAPALEGAGAGLDAADCRGAV